MLRAAAHCVFLCVFAPSRFFPAFGCGFVSFVTIVPNAPDPASRVGHGADKGEAQGPAACHPSRAAVYCTQQRMRCRRTKSVTMMTTVAACEQSPSSVKAQAQAQARISCVLAAPTHALGPALCLHLDYAMRGACGIRLLRCRARSRGRYIALDVPVPVLASSARRADE